jgi:hypothetical protein
LTRLVFFGVDAEKLAKKAVSDSGFRFPWWREEEVVQELLLVAWKLSLVHDQRISRFSTTCYRRMRERIIDEVRKEEGRTRWRFSEEAAKRDNRRHHRTLEQNGNVSVVVEYQRPTVLSLDAPVGSDNDAGLGETLPSFSLDLAADSDEALRWALRSGDSAAGGPSAEERPRAFGRTGGGAS